MCWHGGYIAPAVLSAVRRLAGEGAVLRVAVRSSYDEAGAHQEGQADLEVVREEQVAW